MKSGEIAQQAWELLICTQTVLECLQSRADEELEMALQRQGTSFAAFQANCPDRASLDDGTRKIVLELIAVEREIVAESQDQKNRLREERGRLKNRQKAASAFRVPRADEPRFVARHV